MYGTNNVSVGFLWLVIVLDIYCKIREDVCPVRSLVIISIYDSFIRYHYLFYFLTSPTITLFSPIGTAPVKCYICNQFYFSNGSLRHHVATVHSGIKREPFLCSICGKELFSKRGLKAHQQSHTGEKNYDCHLCGKFQCLI